MRLTASFEIRVPDSLPVISSTLRVETPWIGDVPSPLHLEDGLLKAPGHAAVALEHLRQKRHLTRSRDADLLWRAIPPRLCPAVVVRPRP